MSARSRPGWLDAGLLLAGLFLRQAFGRRRFLWLVLALLLPVLGSLWWRVMEQGSGLQFFQEMTVNALLQLFALGAALFLGVSAVRDEIEDRTIVYLLARPLARWWILASKLLAVAILTAASLTGMALLVYAIGVSADGLLALVTGLPQLGAALGAVALASLVYTALFGLIGILFRHPMIPALLVAFGWEGVVANLPGALPRASIMYYLKSILGLGPEAGGLMDLLLPPIAPVSPLVAVIVLLVVTAVLSTVALVLGHSREVRV